VAGYARSGVLFANSGGQFRSEIGEVHMSMQWARLAYGAGLLTPTSVTNTVTIVVTSSLTCPRCGAEELENPTAPISDWRWQIRPHKVTDNLGSWSQCLIGAPSDPNKGWFCTPF
jgi:hypothetical protein